VTRPETPPEPESPLEPEPPLEPAAANGSRPYETSDETCEVVWWRGYVKSSFCAHGTAPDGTPFLAAESPQFRWRRSEPPERTPETEAALEALLEKLVVDDWEVVGNGGAWYTRTLVRRSET
jgi:hypothetical protein